MHELVINRINGVKNWTKRMGQADQALRAAELFFFLLPTFYLAYQYLFSLLTNQDFLQSLLTKPIYTIQFIVYVSYYFVSLLLKMLQQTLDDSKTDSHIKVILLTLLLCQLLNQNLLCSAIVLLLIRSLYNWQIVQINFRQIIGSKQPLQLIIALFLVLLSAVLALMRTQL